jgi:hypothetical protein
MSEGRARKAEQVDVHPEEMLGDDVQAGFRQEVVDVGDAAVGRVLDRQQRERGPALPHRRHRALEGVARQRLVVGEGLDAGLVRVGAEAALEGDHRRFVEHPA